MAMMLMASDASKERQSERGAALVSVLLISMLLLAAGGALIMTTAMSATNSIDSTAETQAFYAAHAGLQATLNVLRGNVAPNPLIDPSSSTAPGNKISFRKAVTASTSNASGDTNGPRLSHWLSYDATYNDRVILSPPPQQTYSPLNGLAYSTSISDPDNTSQVTFYTQGAFDNNSPSNAPSKNYGNGNAKVTVTFNGQQSATINSSGSSTLGSFIITGTGSQSYTIPTGEIFKLTIVQTAPSSVTLTINCTLSGTISNSSGYLVVTFPPSTNPTLTNSLQGTIFARTATFSNLPIGTTAIPVTVTAPEPSRLLVKVNGYGPRASNKQMQMLLNRFAFDYTATNAITLRSADDNTVLGFNAGDSAKYGYNGYDNAGGVNLSAFGVTSTADYAYLTGLTLSGGQVMGSPSGVQQVSVSSLPTWLQTADAARTFVSQVRIAAQNANRYYTTAVQPPSFGTPSQPLFTFVDGDTDLPPAGGAGLLVVTGTLTLNGSSQFDGLILVLGGGQLMRTGGGNGNSLGSMAVASFGATGNFTAPTFNSNGSGNSAIQYDSEWVRKALASTGPRVMGVSEY